MDKPLDEVIKEDRQKNREQRKKTQKNKQPQKRGVQGFRRGGRENQQPQQARRKLVIKKATSSGIKRENPPKDPNQLRVLNLDFNITESELRVRDDLT